MKVDLHIHTKFSRDSSLEPKDILKVAGGWVDAVGITDHDTIEGALLARKIAGDGGVEVIVGVEVKTDRGEVLGYGIEEEIVERDFWGVVDAIKGQGGIVGLSHPFDTLRYYTLTPNDEIVKALDFVEVFNARCLRSVFNERAMEYARRHKLGVTAGSDAHTLGEIGRAGVISDSLELHKLIENGEVFGERTSPMELLKTKINKIIRF
ncbi:MAG: PHP domain-containing protein [Candidatus Hydrothermarchaeaceae archaeon]